MRPAQQRSTTEVFCGLCATLAAAGAEAMAALHGKRSPFSLRQKEENHAAEMRALMEGLLGKPLDVDLQHESLNPLEAVMRASHESLQQAMQAEMDKRDAARLKQKKNKKPTLGQQKAGP